LEQRAQHHLWNSARSITFRTARAATFTGVDWSIDEIMLENLKRQQAAYLESHGTPMTPSQNAHAIATMLALQSLYFEDSVCEARPELCSASFYASILPNCSCDAQSLADSLERAAIARACCPKSENDSCDSLLSDICDIGYAIGSTATPEVAEVCEELFAIQAQLAMAGLPPQFVFVFDAAWQLLDHLWQSAADVVLGRDSVMEVSAARRLLHDDAHTIQADMNCWALRRDSSNGSESRRYVGGNFGASHRDQRYSASHSAADGSPQSVNVWCAFNPSGAASSNGAMRVIPIQSDDFFYCPSHELHMDTASAIAIDNFRARDAAVVLHSACGQACMWTPSLIHWGGAFSDSSAEEPRSSIAVTFRSRDAPASVFGTHDCVASTASAGGPPPLLREELKHLPLKRRLAYVAKGLLAYSHWHPGFPGVSLHR
jgi:hypothetical protein